MWERIPVGRPHKIEHPQAWFPTGDPVIGPTVAHLYERACGTYHVSRHAYISYTNEIDILLPQQVRHAYTLTPILMHVHSAHHIVCRLNGGHILGKELRG